MHGRSARGPLGSPSSISSLHQTEMTLIFYSKTLPVFKSDPFMKALWLATLMLWNVFVNIVIHINKVFLFTYQL